MQIVVLILCIAVMVLWCLLAFCQRQGEHQVLVFIVDAIATFVVLTAVIMGIFA